mmetsp:Transcript_3538/g.4758  ORF Transcript_3538/g.4758 Transcript_3538/m.4758 type:complete len:399 (-) Transcript_3538:1503-2699(-)
MVEAYLLAGCLLSLFGSIIDNWGMNLQKYSHHLEKTESESKDEPSSFAYSFCGHSVRGDWLFGFAVYVFGQILNFVSLSLIDQPTQSILSSFALFSNVIFARRYFQENFQLRDLMGILFISSGASLFVVFFVHSEQIETIESLQQGFLRPGFFSLLVILAGIFIFCAVYVMKKAEITSYELPIDLSKQIEGSSSRARVTITTIFSLDQSPLAYAIMAALIGGITVTLSKIVSLILRELSDNGFGNEGTHQRVFVSIVVFIWITFLVNSVRVLNVGLKNSPVLVMIPIFYVLSNLTSITVGTVYFMEYETFNSLTSTLWCLLGVFLTVIGIWLLSQRAASSREKEINLLSASSVTSLEVGLTDNVDCQSMSEKVQELDSNSETSYSSCRAQSMGEITLI